MNADGSDPFILVGASLDPTMTLDHEAVHALYNLGLFTPKEWAALSRRAKALWIKQHRVKELQAKLADAERSLLSSETFVFRARKMSCSISLPKIGSFSIQKIF